MKRIILFIIFIFSTSIFASNSELSSFFMIGFVNEKNSNFPNKIENKYVDLEGGFFLTLPTGKDWKEGENFLRDFSKGKKIQKGISPAVSIKNISDRNIFVECLFPNIGPKKEEIKKGAILKPGEQKGFPVRSLENITYDQELSINGLLRGESYKVTINIYSNSAKKELIKTIKQEMLFGLPPVTLGMYGVKWNTSFEEFQKIYPNTKPGTSKHDKDVYLLNSPKYKWEGLKIDKIEYFFDENYGYVGGKSYFDKNKKEIVLKKVSESYNHDVIPNFNITVSQENDFTVLNAYITEISYSYHKGKSKSDYKVTYDLSWGFKRYIDPNDGNSFVTYIEKDASINNSKLNVVINRYNKKSVNVDLINFAKVYFSKLKNTGEFENIEWNPHFNNQFSMLKYCTAFYKRMRNKYTDYARTIILDLENEYVVINLVSTSFMFLGGKREENIWKSFEIKF